jgi:uncharacterized phage protein (TIGR01671 family)
MREILFRGQTRKRGELVHIITHEPLDGKWKYGGVLQGSCAHSIIYGYDNDDQIGTIQKHVVYTDTLGQYTGLKDKNGKRIFEGDIVRARLEEGVHAGFEWPIMRIEYRDAAFTLVDKIGRSFCTMAALAPVVGLEVLGNVHDNPELIGGAEDENA